MESEISKCLGQCRGAFLSVGLLSGVANILALTGSIFMLAVYDRVIPSGSVPTLIALGLIVIVVYIFQAFVDISRGRMLTRVGLVIKESLNGRAYDLLVRRAAAGSNEAGGAVRDLDQLRSFLSSMGPTALFDLPWIPIYIGICFAFHWAIGTAVVVGALFLIALTIASEMLNKRPSQNLHDAMSRRSSLMQASQTNAETLQSMGMTLAMSSSWRKVGDRIVETSRGLSDIQTLLSSMSRSFRMMLQSFVLALGAYLVINQDATGGIMIASSILSARALAPIELSIQHWKSFVNARQSRTRLDKLLREHPAETARFTVPNPTRTLTCENVSLSPFNVNRLVVRDVSFGLRAGEGLGIIGATGSGKSTLVRALVGLLPPQNGTVRFDGSLASQWASTQRGKFLGYLPQRVALFEGTIAQNIARFEPNAEPASVVAAARLCGVHEMIARLPDGYDTMIDETGSGLSGGQSQRIGLARALYGNPFLLVLDEPNSNLDQDGEAALQNAMMATRERGGIVVIVAHRPSALAAVSQVMVMQEGRVLRMGPRDEILENMLVRPAPAPAPVPAATPVPAVTAA